MDLRYIPLFAFGFIGGLCAYFIGAPMPFMLGGISGTAAFVLWYERGELRLPKLTRWVRLVFMAIIGAMIGSRFSPELLTLIPQFWISGLALIPFIVLAHAGSYAIMRKLGGYSKLDAYFAALPGGIVDSAALAEEAGADLRIVTAQHFIRIILVVVSIPFLFLIVQGDAVGSLGGETLADASYDATDVLLLVVIALVGLGFGRLARLPVSHMLGPLLLALVLSISGTVTIDIPQWLMHVAQFMIGTALGAQFSGMSRRLLARGVGIGLVVGIYMLALGATIAVILTHYVPVDFPPLVRILLTVWIGALVANKLFKPQTKP